MKIEDIKGDFSYRENSIKWFTLENYLLVVKDEDHPDKIVTPLLYVDRKAGKAQNIDRYDMDKVLVNLNINKPELGFDRFENQYQVIKITYGNIIANNSDDENAPKCKTFANNLNPTSKNEIVEIIEADILEAEAKIRIKQPNLNTLLTDVYAKDSAPIFVETEGKIIGPFLIVGQEEANCFSIQKYLRKDFSFGEYRITNNTYVEFLHYNINRKLHVVGFNRLDFIQEIDFKDDKEILNEFVSRVSNSPELLNPEQMQQFLNLIDEVRNAKEIKNYIKDNKRVYDLLEKANEKLIADYKLSNLFPQKVNIDKAIEQLEEQETNLKNNIGNKQKQLEKLQNDIVEMEERVANLKEETQKKIAEQEEIIAQELKDLRENREAIRQQVKEEIKEEEQNLVQLRQEKEDLTVIVNSLQQQNRKAQKDSYQELLNIIRNKKYFDIFSGKELADLQEEQQPTFINFSVTDQYQEYQEYRDKIKEILGKNGRNFDSHFVDNLLIAIHQNTLTILAGLPGTGKTSLARLLTQILAPKERVTEVSVSRGWSSPKDLIGFQNPLTNKFHSAPTGVYELLQQLNYEVENNTYLASPLAYIILDEANLSPIEHYWSNFYNLTDSYAQQDHCLSIQLGNNHTLQYANNLRFIATINYDYTTEALSPRVIDRTNIIQLPEMNHSVSFITKEEVETLKISFEKCIAFFQLLDFQTAPNLDISFSDENTEIFREIKEVFKKLRLPISYRVELGIKRYCNMSKYIDDLNENILLDYAIAQRLLPMINVQGENQKAHIDRLSRIFSENRLRVSEKILDKIIEIGENNEILGGNYSYFLTLSYA